MDKKAYVTIGISGAGKSTWVRENLPNAIICSADNFFIKDGKYQFDASKLGAAHEDCFRKYINALMLFKDNPEISVVCENTNLQLWELTPYTLAARAFGWDFQIIKIDCPWDVAAKRNVHGVPENKVKEMFERLQHNNLPKYLKEKMIIVKSFQ